MTPQSNQEQPKSSLSIRLLELRAENVDLGAVLDGLKRFKQDLEALGCEVSITVEDWQFSKPLAVISSESEASQ